MCTTTSKATLLANAKMNEEMRRTLHSFAADLAGSRHTLIAESETEVARKLMEVAFGIAYRKIKENPFSKFVAITISNDDFTANNFTEEDFYNCYELIMNCDKKSLLNEINAVVADLDLKIGRLETEYIAKSVQFIKTSICFE